MSNDLWGNDGLGGSLRREQHYDGRSMLCYSERPTTLAAMLSDIVRRFPERPAIVEDRAITYRELDGLTRTIAAGLSDCGIVRGDRVALFLGNCWEFLACVLACNRIGAIVVPIGTRQRQAELEFLLNDSGAKVLIFESDLADAIPPRSALPALAQMFSIRGTASGARLFDELLTAPTQALPSPHISEEDVAVILYTSGTTGRPKGAQLTHLGIIHSALTFARCHGLTETDRGLVAVPLSHVTGLVGVALSTMIVGGCVVLMRQAYKTPDFLALASREKITYSILVPTIYTLCAMHPELEFLRSVVLADRMFRRRADAGSDDRNAGRKAAAPATLECLWRHRDHIAIHRDAANAMAQSYRQRRGDGSLRPDQGGR